MAVHFPLYEKMKAWAGEFPTPLSLGLDLKNVVPTAPEDGGPLNSQRILVCSALSKMVASVITYPHEVLRTRLQIQRRERADLATTHSPNAPTSGAQVNSSHRHSGGQLSGPQQTKHGLLQTMSSIAKQDGWKGFYRGISINLVRTVPSSAVTMLT